MHRMELYDLCAIRTPPQRDLSSGACISSGSGGRALASMMVLPTTTILFSVARLMPPVLSTMSCSQLAMVGCSPVVSVVVVV